MTATVTRSERATASEKVKRPTREQLAQVRETLGDRHLGDRHVAQVDRRRELEQLADRRREHRRLVHGRGVGERGLAQDRRQRRAAEAVALLRVQAFAQVRGRGAIPVSREQPREQLLGRLAGVELDLLELLARQQQPRFELQQRRDQDQELGRRLEIELAAALEVIDVGDHDFGQVDLEQVDLLAQDQRQQQVKRTREYVEVQLEVYERHAGRR